MGGRTRPTVCPHGWVIDWDAVGDDLPEPCPKCVDAPIQRYVTGIPGDPVFDLAAVVNDLTVAVARLTAQVEALEAKMRLNDGDGR